MKIEDIENPKFLEYMKESELEELCAQIRYFLVSSIAETGGHLSSNLGIVEVSTALLKVFNSPKDKIIYDVGHQSYVHKILTGRAKEFKNLRQFGGIAGFQKRCESEYDSWEAGHSSTSLSGALGMAIARDLQGNDENIISVIGDGALGGGMALEALNQISDVDSKVIIVLNDNEMSIGKPIGATTSILSYLRMSKPYLETKNNLKEVLSKNAFGEAILDGLTSIRDGLKHKILGSNWFTNIGIDYLGPIDGHNIGDLISAFELAKQHEGSIIVHVVTKKGKGYKYAENDSKGKWHGVAPFDVMSGNPKKSVSSDYKSYSEIVADYLEEYAQNDPNLVVLTPAMISGSKLNSFFERHPDKAFDCGIAEEHTVTMAGGMAANGLHPFVSIYSSFMQRAYDQINHDIARMNLPVVFGVDRAGLVGEDGETHHGVFDISFLRSIPNVVVCEAKDYHELRDLLYTGFKSNKPFFVRYPRGGEIVTDIHEAKELPIGSYEVLVGRENADVVIFSYGSCLHDICELASSSNHSITVVNARFLKPMDENMLMRLSNAKLWIVYEEDMKAGGLSGAISEFAEDHSIKADIKRIGIEDHYVTHGSVNVLKEQEGLTMKHIQDIIEDFYGETR